MNNPFQFGRELGSDELVDRVDDVTAVVQTIQQGGKLFLIGPRRYGKTSILKVASDRATRKGQIVLRYNAEGYPTLDLLVSAIITDAAKALKGGIERAGEQVRQFFAKLRPELSFSVSQSSWSVKLGAGIAEPRAQVKLLVDALNGLEKMASNHFEERPIGLIIDEFQKVIESGDHTAEGQIRAAIQQHKRIAYIFAGSKTRLLSEMTTNAARPFYRLGSLRFIGPVPRHDFAVFLLAKFTQGRFRVNGRDGKEPDSGPMALILDLAEEVPYNVQVLAHACWEHLSGLPVSGHVLTEKVVRYELERIIRQYDPFYTQLWNQLTAVQQKALVEVRAEHGLNLQSQRVTKAFGKGPATMRRALEALLAKDIVREEELQGQVRYRFEDPFLGVWVEVFAAKS